VKLLWHPGKIDSLHGAPDGYYVYGITSQKTVIRYTTETWIDFPCDSLITEGITRIYWYVRAANNGGKSAPSDTVNQPMTRNAFLFGDANNDSTVDVIDSAIFWQSGVMGAVAGMANYNSRWDINTDGKIDVLDHLAFVINIGQRRK